MSAFDARGECLSRTRGRWLEPRKRFAAGSFGDRSFGLRRRDLVEYALRHRDHTRQLGLACRNHFFCRLSEMVAAAGNGVFTFALVSGRAGGRSACFWQTSHGGGWFLRHLGWPRG